jgi:signal transduction histidine kinase
VKDATHRGFLVIAPMGRDGELICGLLNGHGYASECAPRIADSLQFESTQLLGLILTDEALAGDGIEALRNAVQVQPVWSDFPVILLTSGPAEPHYGAVATRARLEIRSLFLLDRPVRKELLLSAVQVAFIARMKQFAAREAAEQQVNSEEALRNTEKLAVAGRLAATMAHEVNNPLEALGNLLFLVENSSGLDEAKSHAHLATQELNRITEIVQQTLRFHRAPGKPDLVDLAELAASAVALFQGKMHERHISEKVRARRALAYCSAGEIRQALVNLIGNALDSMPHGGQLFVRITPVTSNGAHFARITVADTGSGIHREIRKNLFQQFFTTKGSRGTGLGLWLTRDIVQRNQGRLRYRSQTGQPSGTAFSIYLPATAPLDLVKGAPPRVDEVSGAA